MGLWGQSAGGVSVDWYNYAHYKDPIVSNLMMDSGTALLPGSTGTPGNFSYVAAQVGCGGRNSSEELACMREVDAQKLSDVIGTSNETLVFYATYDEKLYFRNYTDRATRGLMADIVSVNPYLLRIPTPHTPLTSGYALNSRLSLVTLGKKATR